MSCAPTRAPAPSRRSGAALVPPGPAQVQGVGANLTARSSTPGAGQRSGAVLVSLRALPGLRELVRISPLIHTRGRAAQRADSGISGGPTQAQGAGADLRPTHPHPGQGSAGGGPGSPGILPRCRELVQISGPLIHAQGKAAQRAALVPPVACPVPGS